VRLFSSLGLVVAPPACEPGKDTPAIVYYPRLHRLAPGQPPLLAARWPGARVSPLISQVAFHLQSSGIVCNIADFSEGFHGPCLDPVSSPDRTLTLSRLSASFLWLTRNDFEPPEPFARADSTVATDYPLVTAIHSGSKLS